MPLFYLFFPFPTIFPEEPIIFIGFCIFILLRNTIAVEIGLYISIISSFEELVITLIGKKYEENIKGICEIKKFKK